MIINIRGTSGSGKSHLVREVMEQCTDRVPEFVEGRKRPLYYTMRQPNGRTLAVVGHYETACGGCDTITKLDDIYSTVRMCADAGYDVLFEGLLISAEVNRAAALSEGQDMLVIGLTQVPLEVCVDSVNARRRAKDPDKPPVNPKNTEAKWKQTRRACDRLEAESHAEVHRLNREDALDTIQRALKWTA